jgi:hypothetical protein
MRWLSAALVAAVCVAEAWALGVGRARPTVVTRPESSLPAYTSGPGDAAFLAHVTADDVARGVWALAEERGELALSPEQRASLAPLLMEGAETRRRLGELRAARRVTAEALMIAVAP